MKNQILFLFLILSGCFACAPTDNSSEESVAGSSTTITPEEEAINQVVQDAYSVISFEKGTKPDYAALAAIFTPDATLANFRNDTLESYSISEFIAGYKSAIDGGSMQAFREVELGGKTEYFGKIGHRISAYASYIDDAEEIGEKGVNSFQVMKVNGKWLISSIIWDVEKEGQLIPDKYLGMMGPN